MIAQSLLDAVARSFDSRLRPGYHVPLISRFRNLTLFSLADSSRLAARVPRCAQGVIRDSVVGFQGCPFPRRIGLFLTNRCNFGCEMCAVLEARKHGSEMPFGVVERVYRESAAHGAVIDLIGGEPLLYRNFADVLRLAAKSRVVSVVTTNGLLLRDHADSIVESRLPVLQVSLDGWDEESQRLRGNVRGSFERIAEGISALQRARGRRAFPIVRILTAITRNNHAHLDRIQSAAHALGVRYWGLVNYFFVTPPALAIHRAFALRHGLNGAIAAHAIEGDLYLAAGQVQELKDCLTRVRAQNQRLRMHISYNWKLDLDRYYSPGMPSRRARCDLPYSRLDVHADGSIAVCVSGKTVGHIEDESLRQVWRGGAVAAYRRLYEATRPMPMCFRCCGMSNRIRFDSLYSGWGPRFAPK